MDNILNKHRNIPTPAVLQVFLLHPDPGPSLPDDCVEWSLERIGEDNHEEAVGTNVIMAK